MSVLKYVYVDDLGKSHAFSLRDTRPINVWEKRDKGVINTNKGPLKIHKYYHDAYIYEAREADFLPKEYWLVASYSEKEREFAWSEVHSGRNYTIEFRMIKITDFQKILKDNCYEPIEPPKQAGRKPAKLTPVKSQAEHDREELVEYYVDWAEDLSDIKKLECFGGNSDCSESAKDEFSMAVKSWKNKPAMAVNSNTDNVIREVLKIRLDLRERLDKVKEKAKKLKAKKDRYR